MLWVPSQYSQIGPNVRISNMSIDFNDKYRRELGSSYTTKTKAREEERHTHNTQGQHLHRGRRTDTSHEWKTDDTTGRVRGENTIYREEEEIRTKLRGRKEQDTIHLANKNMRTHFRYRRYRRMETRAELTPKRYDRERQGCDSQTTNSS